MTTEPDIMDSGTEPDIAAAELALGVLDGEEQAAALRRMVADPEFAREVEQWRNRFAMLFSGVPEETAPTGLFERVESQLAGDRKVVPMRSANLWKPAALAASLALLVMSAVALRPVETPSVPTAAPPLIAAMALTDTTQSQPALYDPDAGQVRMPGPMPIPAGRSAQLWVIVGNGAPKPLGTFRAIGSGAYVAEANVGAAIAPGSKLAISIEPMGGSPTGAPTGPVIASGVLTKV